jgi:hypothetical protein
MSLLPANSVKIEHTIGIWKGRCPFLQNIRVHIASKKDMRFLLKLVKASAVIHNLFLQQQTVPKLSMDYLIDAYWESDLDVDCSLDFNIASASALALEATNALAFTSISSTLVSTF